MKNLIKKFSAVLLILSLLFTNITVFAATEPSFPDISKHWAKQALQNSIDNGLLLGINGKIMPDAPLTRAQMAAIMTRAFNAKYEAPLTDFNDVASDAWYYKDMAKSVGMLIFKGADKKLRPNDNITREEAFAVIRRAICLDPAAVSDMDGFTDVSKISAWAKGEVAALVKAQYIVGSKKLINPLKNITRAEFATMLDRVISEYLKPNSNSEITSFTGKNLMLNTPNVTLKNLTINGDLYLGDGVNEGNITFENVVINGRLVARGGGSNSIHFSGSTNILNLISSRLTNAIRYVVSETSKINTFVVFNGSKDVLFEGDFNKGVVKASDANVFLNSVKSLNVEITGQDSTVYVKTGSRLEVADLGEDADRSKYVIEGSVGTVTNKANNSIIELIGSAIIDELNILGFDVQVKGNGSIGVLNDSTGKTTIEMDIKIIPVEIQGVSIVCGGKTINASYVSGAWVLDVSNFIETALITSATITTSKAAYFVTDFAKMETNTSVPLKDLFVQIGLSKASVSLAEYNEKANNIVFFSQKIGVSLNGFSKTSNVATLNGFINGKPVTIKLILPASLPKN